MPKTKIRPNFKFKPANGEMLVRWETSKIIETVDGHGHGGQACEVVAVSDPFPTNGCIVEYPFQPGDTVFPLHAKEILRSEYKKFGIPETPGTSYAFVSHTDYIGYIKS